MSMELRKDNTFFACLAAIVYKTLKGKFVHLSLS